MRGARPLVRWWSVGRWPARLVLGALVWLSGCSGADCDAQCEREVDVCMYTLIRLREANDLDRERLLISAPEHSRRDDAFFRAWSTCERQAKARSKARLTT